MKFVLQEIRSSYDGFAQLVDLAHETNNLSFGSVIIDMRAATWIDANMCAPLGAVLYKVGRRLNNVQLININSEVESILSKNAFLSNYGHAKSRDTWGTTIRYQHFDTKDDRFFGAYIANQFRGKAIPEMTPGLRKKFWESIFEIFSNAVIHSSTEMGIFACGQFFPKKNRLDFSIADLGIGIRRNLRMKVGLDLRPEQAIAWAMEGRNTTKAGPIPGGLGLKLLREFIALNKGKIHIVSDRGYWELANGQVQTRLYAHSFPGTVVNIEINTADKSSYRLVSKPSTDDIF